MTIQLTRSSADSFAQTYPNATAYLRIAFGVALLALFSQLALPLKPVPITLQTVAVLFVGMTFPRRHAVQSVLAYLGLGVLGLPFFSHANHGFAYLMGPTFGYLMGFILAAAVVSTLRDRRFSKPTVINQLMLGVIGTCCIYAPGVLWLSKLMGLNAAIQVGLLPFFIPGMIKIGILTSLLQLHQRVWKQCKQK